MRTFLLAAIAAALLLAGPTAADNPQLVGTVGPGFTITLKDAAGNAVTHLDPGAYTLVVHDLADVHDFHVVGGNGAVNLATDVEFVGDKTFTIELVDGTYNYYCDPHFATMHGTFTVGNVQTPPTPSGGSGGSTAKALTARVGPGSSLAFPAKLTHGRYAITVRDLSAHDNLHLKGPGVDRKTGVAFKGSVRWTLALKVGSYTASSDAHPKLRRTVIVS